MTIRVPLPIPRALRGQALAKAQHHRAPAPEQAVASTLREGLCSRLALAADASNADILAAVDARLAGRTAPAGVAPAAASLYARAFGSAPRPSAAATTHDLAAKAGWGV